MGEWIAFGRSFKEFIDSGLCVSGVQLCYEVEVRSKSTWVAGWYPEPYACASLTQIPGDVIGSSEVRVLIGDRDYQGGIEREGYDVLDDEIITRYRVIATPEQLAS